jgi:two-component system, NtrC family, sensor kinase
VAKVVLREIGRVPLNLFRYASYVTQQKKQKLYEKQQAMRAGGHYSRKNGTRMGESVKSKIFQPIITAKPTGQGTDLGLSLSYDIITKGHGGALRVETKEGDGSEFMVVLPIQSFLTMGN